MRSTTRLSLLLAVLAAAPALAAPSDIQRLPLGKYPVVGGKTVDRVEMQRLTLAPGGKTGLHLHPGPVASYVVSGRIVVQVQGGPAQTFTAGQTIFEPANTPIARFDNLSATEPAVFVADYLLSASDQDLIKKLD